MNNLKLINDGLGHAAGDRAIRAVASAVRSIIRADGLLFRWGGDEFLVLMFGMPEAMARQRLETWNVRLAQAQADGAYGEVSVSHGLARFDTLEELQQAIEDADVSMYARKQKRKALSLVPQNAA